jgi:LysM repeat protein
LRATCTQHGKIVMNRQRSILVLIVVPAVISLLVTLLVLYIWDRQQPPVTTIVLPTYGPTSQLPPRVTQSASRPGGTPGGEGSSAEVSGGEAEGDVIPPGCENPTHVVASGEVLGTIAEQYSVSVADLIALNQLIDPAFDPDFLAVDQELVIPVCGIPTPTLTLTPIDTPIPTRVVPTPIPTATELPPGTIRMVIAEVINPGDITSEAIEIANEGSPVDLEGWTLSNGRDDEFVFPPFRLFSGGRVAIHTGVGENTPIDLYWGLNEPVWQVGDTAALFDPDGKLHDEFEIGP